MLHHLKLHYFVQKYCEVSHNLVDISNHGDLHGLMCNKSESCSLLHLRW